MKTVGGFGSLMKRLNLTNKTMVGESGWSFTRYGGKDFLKDLTRTGIRIGEKSVHGTVESLSYKGDIYRYVIKKININPRNNADNLHMFKTEVNVGSIQGIKKVGPRIFAYRKTPFSAEYIMDNVQLGKPGSKIYTLNQVKKKLSKDEWKLLDKTVNEFHKITKGMHGDLHGGNILFIVRPDGKEYFKIIDYGAFRHNENLNYKKKGIPVLKHYGVSVYNFGIGQRFINNKNFLNVVRKLPNKKTRTFKSVSSNNIKIETL